LEENMSLFEQFVKEAGIILGGQTGTDPAGTGQPGAPGNPMIGIIEMLSHQGLGPLAQRFKDKGLGDIIASWVSPGANQPITPGQIEHGLGPEVIETLAVRLGLPPAETSALLSQYLPQIIDKLTPHGTIEGVPTVPGP
jgi:uncharacterized protein YidB (DUF937 family)